MKNLKNSFNNMKEKTESVYDVYKGKLEETGEKIKDKTQEFLEEGKEQFANLEQSAVKYEEQFINKVQERPLISLLIAAGVGFLISSFLKK